MTNKNRAEEIKRCWYQQDSETSIELIADWIAEQPDRVAEPAIELGDQYRMKINQKFQSVIETIQRIATLEAHEAELLGLLDGLRVHMNENGMVGSENSAWIKAESHLRKLDEAMKEASHP